MLKIKNSISFAIFCTVGNTDRFLEYWRPLFGPVWTVTETKGGLQQNLDAYQSAAVSVL